VRFRLNKGANDEREHFTEAAGAGARAALRKGLAATAAARSLRFNQYGSFCCRSAAGAAIGNK
jgi:hypothetical protein